MTIEPRRQDAAEAMLQGLIGECGELICVWLRPGLEAADNARSRRDHVEMMRDASRADTRPQAPDQGGAEGGEWTGNGQCRPSCFDKLGMRRSALVLIPSVSKDEDISSNWPRRA